MNRLFSKALAIGALACSAAASQAGIIVTFGGAPAPNQGLTTSVAGATVFDFNGSSRVGCTAGYPAAYTGGSIISGSSSGQYAAPPGDTTCYLTVGSTQPLAGTATADFGATTYNYFGLYWGSIDGYNTLRFFSPDAKTAIGSFTGDDLKALDPSINLGSQSADGARYVNFFFDGGGYNRVQFLSTQAAFESDNHAVTKVPEPATLGLLGLGLMGIGFARRRRATI